MVLSTDNKKIAYISLSYSGKIHDYTLLKKEFSSKQNWFENFTLQVDLAYFGINTAYKIKEVLIPHKNPKGKELTEEQKEENKVLASQRIKVEHSISGLKRYRILVDRLRIHLIDLYDNIVGVCAGLWNFNLSN
jgi:hypothetical protein